MVNEKEAECSELRERIPETRIFAYVSIIQRILAFSGSFGFLV